MRLFAFFILFAISALNLNAQWQLQAEYPEGTKNFKEIFFSDENNGWIADESGPYLYTTDGGETWNENSLGEIAHDVVFTSIDTGFICYDHYIKKTTDGGDNWYEVWGNWGYITKFSFADEKHAWALWDDDIGLIPFTTDSGETWNYMNTISGMIYMEIYTLDLVARDTGWVYLRRVDSEFDQYWEIYKTVNGGESWILKNPSPNTNLRDDMFFINDSTGWLTGGSSGGYRILYTNNNGQTWEYQELTNGGDIGTVKSIHFVNDTLGWLTTANQNSGSIFKTTDSGTNWIKQVEYTYPMQDIFMLNKNKGWAVGKNRIYKYYGSNSVKEIPGDEFSISIYPNPSKGVFTLNFPFNLNKGNINIIINDFTGKTLIIDKTINKNLLTFDLSMHPPGIYFITISAEEHIITKKIIKI